MEGISQAEMLAFLFDAAYECEKFAKAYLSSFTQRQRAMREYLCSHMATVCESGKLVKRVSHSLHKRDKLRRNLA